MCNVSSSCVFHCIILKVFASLLVCAQLYVYLLLKYVLDGAILLAQPAQSKPGNLFKLHRFKSDDILLPRRYIEESCGQLCLYPNCCCMLFFLDVPCRLWTNHIYIRVSILGDLWYLVPQLASDYFDLLEHSTLISWLVKAKELNLVT